MDISPHEKTYRERIEEDLQEKMVLVSGPRQVGKTTLAKTIAGSKGTYYNWDYFEHRDSILKNIWPKTKSILVLDEIHKYRKWRNLVKGLYDVNKDHLSILVTGSAKLDIYRRGGDSLQGRYHLYRMHPFTIQELGGNKNAWKDLFTLGGFPEPFLRGSELKANRWRKEYRSLLIREELTALEDFKDLGSIELLAIRLPSSIASPLSINAIREDLQVAHKTAEKWIQGLESLYYCYTIPPFGSSKIKSVKKEKKLYLWDWSSVEEKGPRFENMVGSHLLKLIHLREDSFGEDWNLCFYRDWEKREVDFILVKNGKPFCFIECKLSETNIDPSLKYLKNKFPKVPSYQLTHQAEKSYSSKEGIIVMDAFDFFKTEISELIYSLT